MKKIIIGGAFLIGGYWLIKNFLNKGFDGVEKPKLEFIPTDTELLGTYNGTEIRYSLEDRELNYEKSMAWRDNPTAMMYGWTLFRDDFTEENAPKLYALKNLKPYSIDYTAINNLGKVGSLNLGFPSEEEIKVSVDKFKTGTPIQPTWSKS